MTDGDVVFTAVEDLGGGLKATASIATLMRGRDTTVSGRDATISVAGGFGTVMIGAIEAGNGIIPLAGAGAPTIGLDTFGAAQSTAAASGISRTAVSAAANTDILMYTSPNISGFSFSAAMMDATTAFGAESTSAAQDSTMLRVNYANGPLAAMADLTSFGKNSLTTAATTADDRVRMSASYDLGVAKIGAGYEKIQTLATTNNGNKQTMFGVSVPVGAFTFGATSSNNKLDGGTTIKGTEMGVNYALSKRTAIQVATQKIKETGVTGSADRTRIRLLHSF